jgi:imidazolonepropionase-like amidohydrolase
MTAESLRSPNKEHFGSPPDVQYIDCADLTVLPGLMDLHSHMGVVSLNAAAPISAAMTAALLFENARACITSGYTTAREVGGADGALGAVIDAGYINGPRLYPSGPLLCQSAGHGDMNNPWSQDHHSHFGIPGLAQLSLVCDGPDGVRRGAREAFRLGATQIKVCISGGVVSHSDKLTDTQFSVEELRAAVAEAKSRGTYVTGHALNSAAIMLGLGAGMECFEHGINLDEQTANAVREADASIVATLTILHLMASDPQAMGVPLAFAERLGSLARDAQQSLRIAYEAGVRLGSGTDILGPAQSRRGLEIPLKAEVIGAMPALLAATRTNAEILGRSDHLGTVEVGKLADIIAVSGDPLAEPELFDDPDRVELVIKDGVVVKDLRGRARDVFVPRLEA